MGKKSRERRERQIQRLIVKRKNAEIEEMKGHVGLYDMIRNWADRDFRSTIGGMKLASSAGEKEVAEGLRSDLPAKMGVLSFIKDASVIVDCTNLLSYEEWLELGNADKYWDTDPDGMREIELLNQWDRVFSGLDLRLPFEHTSLVYSDPPNDQDESFRAHYISIMMEKSEDGYCLRGKTVNYSAEPQGEDDWGFFEGADEFVVHLNKDGELASNVGFGSMLDDHFSLGDLHPNRITEIAVTLKAASILNCRNVELVDKPLPPPNVQHVYEREYGQPMTVYKTLKLKGTRKVYPENEQDSVSNSHSHKRLHLVRGHAVKYTEEAPRFGRDVGTFWRSAHVRGDESIGTVVKDYEIGGAVTNIAEPF